MTSALGSVFVRVGLVVLVTQASVLGATDVAVGGTMVVAVRFREGLVVCADKRSHLDGPGLPKGNYRDDDVKITLISQIGGFVTVPRFGPTSDCALARNGKSIEWRPHEK